MICSAVNMTERIYCYCVYNSRVEVFMKEELWERGGDKIESKSREARPNYLQKCLGNETNDFMSRISYSTCSLITINFPRPQRRLAEFSR